MTQLWEILVPTVRRRDGKPYRTRYHRVWDAKVRAMAGGLTIMKPSVGHWLSDRGDVFVERMIPVRVACERAVIELIMDLTAEYYEQLAVMCWKVSDEVLIKEYEKGS